MIHHLLTPVVHFIVSVISWGGYPGIIVLMTIESACIPLPSEIIMPFSGYLAGLGRFTLIGVTLSGAAGNLLGSVIIYKASGSGIYPWLRRLSPHHVDKAERFYNKYGILSVFLGRLLPVLRTFISLPAGIMRVPFKPFCFWTFAGSLPWCFALAYLGRILGQNWQTLEPAFHRIDFPILVLLLGGVGLWIWKNRD